VRDGAVSALMNQQSEKIGILIADDHPQVREGLRKALESEPSFDVLGEAADGEQTLELVARLEPKVLLLDMKMPKLSGREVLRELKALAVPIRTLILTAALEKNLIIEAFQLDAQGIILKHTHTDVLFKGIRSVLAGQFWVCDESVSNPVQAFLKFELRAHADPRRPEFSLSEGELDAIALIVSGYTNKGIARNLAISVSAVQNHLTNILDKLELSNRFELILFSMHHHLTDDIQIN